MITQQMVVQARGISKVYRRGQERIEALRGIDFEVNAGAFVVILGPSGGGKSSLLHLLGAIDTPTAGQLMVCGVMLHQSGEVERTRFRRDKVGVVFQFYNLMPSLSAVDNVALPLLAQGQSWSKARQRAVQGLREVGLDHRLKHLPGQLSGGEQQRVAIARALISRPGLLLADEPTGDLDTATSEDILTLMVNMHHQSGTSMIIATHNQTVAQAADQVYDLRDGRLSLARGNV